MIDYSKYHIDYYTSTPAFEEALDMKVGLDENIYHWKKMKHFYNGNIILVRDSKLGIDYLIQLLENGRELTQVEKEMDKKWAVQKYTARYKIIAKDDKPSKEKTRYIPKAVKNSILEKYDYKCQGSNKIMGGTLKEELPVFRCDINFREGEHKPDYDHILEFSVKGGLTVEDNILPLCKGCHAMKTAFSTRDLTNQLAMVEYSPNVIG
jgi:hypothetical protein